MHRRVVVVIYTYRHDNKNVWYNRIHHVSLLSPMSFLTFTRSILHRSVALKAFAKPLTCRYFGYSRHKLRNEVHKVPVGGNGSIDLVFVRPARESTKRNYLIRLPPGPFPKRCTPSWPSTTADEIAQSLPTTTVIDVQYRLAERDFSTEIDHRFPTPIHDIYAAFDYVNGIIEEESAVRQNDESRIAIYGSHIGGALALSLALTSPNQIHGLCIENPMVDWPILEEIANQSLSKRKRADSPRKDAQLEAAKALIALRSALFRSPSGYFDSFASPVLFLRAPGRDTPLTNSAAPASGDQGFFQGSPIRYGDEDDEVGLVEYEDQAYGPYDDEWHAAETTKERNQYYRIDDKDNEGSGQLQSLQTQEGASGSDDESNAIMRHQQQVHPRRRKVLQRWPPNNAYSEDALLPLVSILSGSSISHGDMSAGDAVDISPVIDMQVVELAELLRRACFWGRERSFAEERVTLRTFDENVSAAQRQNVLLERLTGIFA